MLFDVEVLQTKAVYAGGTSCAIPARVATRQIVTDLSKLARAHVSANTRYLIKHLSSPSIRGPSCCMYVGVSRLHRRGNGEVLICTIGKIQSPTYDSTHGNERRRKTHRLPP